MHVLRMFEGVFGELFMSCLECAWHLIRVHLCRIGPEGPRRPAVLAVAESVQRLPEVCRSEVVQEDVKGKSYGFVID
ncbi:hypothetical protein MANES_08G050150v8 [Manihot esculenta]|uniref:Uncharacterized protein n=1 Tax=Manihot esculenta TaxID=3983 RepID=A0ACB7HAC8_MANES|nr:hypothetical protein MANES_08G050150v8 [Manihot esculenta]